MTDSRDVINDPYIDIDLRSPRYKLFDIPAKQFPRLCLVRPEMNAQSEFEDYRSSKQCIYCGASGLNSEHFMGKWLTKIRPVGSGTRVRTRSITKRGEPFIKGHVRKSNGSLYHVHVRRVCASCNGGWLSKIQQAAKPIILKLLDEEPHDLASAEMLPLLAWVVNATILGEYTDPPTAAISKNDVEHFFKSQTPPPEWNIWIGRYKGLLWPDRYFHTGVTRWKPGTPWPKTPAPNAQVTQIVVGGLHLLVSSAEGAPPQDFSGEEKDLLLAKIWPLRSQSLPWPFLRMATDAEMNSMATRITKQSPEGNLLRQLAYGLTSDEVYQQQNRIWTKDDEFPI